MKKSIVLSLSVLVFGFACAQISLAQDSNESHETHGAEAAAPAKAEKKTGRKKRQLMCKDCGKPEVHCECEGHKEKKSN